MDPQQLQLLVDLLARGQTAPTAPMGPPGAMGPPAPPQPGVLSPEMLAQLQAQFAGGPPPPRPQSPMPGNMSMLERFLSTLSNAPSSMSFGGGPYQP